jgi:hypothetical protein
MWYALGHIEEPAPIIRVVQVVPSRHKPPAIPAGWPGFMHKRIQVPRQFRVSEFQSLAYVAKQAGISFAHAGPDYALWDCPNVPYGQPVTVYQMLWSLEHSYIPGELHVDRPPSGQWVLQAVNQKP